IQQSSSKSSKHRSLVLVVYSSRRDQDQRPFERFRFLNECSRSTAPNQTYFSAILNCTALRHREVCSWVEVCQPPDRILYRNDAPPLEPLVQRCLVLTPR